MVRMVVFDIGTPPDCGPPLRVGCVRLWGGSISRSLTGKCAISALWEVGGAMRTGECVLLALAAMLCASLPPAH
jgi:hypothetical protein